MPMLVLLIFAVGVVCGVAFASLRRGGGAPSWVESPRPLELERRLAHLEQAAEESGRAMERLEEGQRFLLNALTDQRIDHPSAPRRALAPGEHQAAPPRNPSTDDIPTPPAPPNERRG